MWLRAGLATSARNPPAFIGQRRSEPSSSSKGIARHGWPRRPADLELRVLACPRVYSLGRRLRSPYSRCAQGAWCLPCDGDAADPLLPRTARRPPRGDRSEGLQARTRLTWGRPGHFREPESLGAASGQFHQARSGTRFFLTKEEKPRGSHHCNGQSNEKPSEGARGGAARGSASLCGAGGRTPSSDGGELLELRPHLRPACSKSLVKRSLLPRPPVYCRVEGKWDGCVQPHGCSVRSSQVSVAFLGHFLHMTDETHVNVLPADKRCCRPLGKGSALHPGSAAVSLGHVLLQCRGWQGAGRSDPPAVVRNHFPACSFFFPLFLSFLIIFPLRTYMLGFCLISSKTVAFNYILISY